MTDLNGGHLVARTLKQAGVRHLFTLCGGHTAPGFHRKRTGLNHLAFRVPHREDVDRFANDFLAPRGLAPLYETPREFPEYRPGYYAVFFEDPDRLKLEVVHIPESPQTP